MGGFGGLRMGDVSAGKDCRLLCNALGEMAEWSIAHPWKGCIRENVSGVRIPLSPQ